MQADYLQNVGGCTYANAATALKTAHLFVSLGLKDLGYTYVNIDDCWSSKSRNASGYIVPDPSKWPNGMKDVADQIHNLGLKLGLYGCAGTMTCAGYPGSQGHETLDAELLASWGIDYWKYDNCYTPCKSWTPQTCYSASGTSQTWYKTMSEALQKSGKPILFSLCNWGRDNVWTWGASLGNSWRMSTDIGDNWNSVARIASAASALSQYAAPGGFNDLDMMVRLSDSLEWG
jgi:alpha-galactosidase